MENSRYLSIAQVAKMLGISRQAVYKRVRNGKVKAIRVGRSYAIPREYLGKRTVDITGRPLKEKEKELIEKSVKKTVTEYGDVLKKLGRE